MASAQKITTQLPVTRQSQGQKKQFKFRQQEKVNKEVTRVHILQSKYVTIEDKFRQAGSEVEQDGANLGTFVVSYFGKAEEQFLGKNGNKVNDEVDSKRIWCSVSVNNGERTDARCIQFLEYR